jgi:hypothetical protein
MQYWTQPQTMKKHHFLFVFLWLEACQPSALTQREASQNQNVWELNRLYFGRAMPNGREVSEREWKQFLAENVTPSFPEGLTVWHAEGQWPNDSGRIAQERTFVLEIAYLPDTLKNRKLQTVIDRYSHCFQQQSVMRITEKVQVSF